MVPDGLDTMAELYREWQTRGETICSPAEVFNNSCNNDQEWYDGAQIDWFLWGVTMRNRSLALDVFSRAFAQWPLANSTLQTAIQKAVVLTSTPADCVALDIGMKSTLVSLQGDDAHFVRAVIDFLKLCAGGTHKRAANLADKFRTHVASATGDADNFDTWVRQEITFTQWQVNAE